MLTNLSDIYSAKVGDKIVLNKSHTVVYEVYAEAISNRKWVSVLEHLIDPTWVVEILNPDDIKNVDITDHIISSEFHGMEEDGRLVLELPKHINIPSLKSRVYAKCKGYKVEFFDNYLIIRKRLATYNASVIIEDFSVGDIKTIDKSECKNLKSTVTSLYRLASEAGFTIRINSKGHVLVITHTGDLSDTAAQKPFATRLTEWLTKLPYDMTVDLPSFTDIKSSAYINTVLNKSNFACKVYRGQVTKRSAALRKRRGKIEVVVNEKVIKVINKPSLTSISKRDRVLINLALMPYKRKYEDVR